MPSCITSAAAVGELLVGPAVPRDALLCIAWLATRSQALSTSSGTAPGRSSRHRTLQRALAGPICWQEAWLHQNKSRELGMHGHTGSNHSRALRREACWRLKPWQRPCMGAVLSSLSQRTTGAAASHTSCHLHGGEGGVRHPGHGGVGVLGGSLRGKVGPIAAAGPAAPGAARLAPEALVQVLHTTGGSRM